jgi:hypothetical protein
VNPDAREQTPASPAPWTWRTTVLALAWSAGVFAIYLANGREIWSGDSVPAKYLTCALVRGDGFYLDRYRPEVLKWWPYPSTPYYLSEVDGHYVSRYPIGPVLVALPFTMPQMLFLDWTHPGWETSDPLWFDTIAKRSAAAITTLAALALLAVLRKLGLGREAWLAALAAALGSNLWSTASQSLWQHGPAALMLTLLLLLLWPEAPSRLRFFAAGLTAALLVCSRPVDLAFAVMTAFWVTLRHPRQLVWFLPPAMVGGVALIGYNRAYLGAAGGYYSTFDAATFGTPWFEGLMGTLLSPSHGLFVFSPWTLIAVAYLPFAFFRLRPAMLLPWLLATLGAHALLISTFSCWWAGLCFGPRYWTEVIPLLAIVLGLALAWARVRCRPIFAVSLVLIAVSIGVQFLGAAMYPSGWEDHAQEEGERFKQRLWDWSDTELSRCIVVSRAYRALFGAAEAKAVPAPAVSPSNQPAAAVLPMDDDSLDRDVKENFSMALKSNVSPMAAGSLDRVDCERIEGWAWDPRQPETPIAVDLYDGETLLATVTADRLRRDLVRNQQGDGKHGFVFNTPASLKDAMTHQIHAKFAGPGIELNKSPQEFACPEPVPR